MRYTATYSPEDNKLRLYASSRLDADTYARAKALGFKWAPRQELFVAPTWSPAAEDFLIELAGEIEAEQSTMAERAEAKAERLEALSDKRRREASAYSNAAHRISERFAGGQPILVGHHSERRARRDRDKMDAAMRKAIAADKAAGWWLYKASAAQHHANRKNRDDVRARRIKTLLASLRDLQRRVNHAYIALDILDRATTPEAIHKICGLRLESGSICDWNAWGDLDRGKRTADQVKADAIAMHEGTLSSDGLSRWIAHTLNRLGYERELLGPVELYTGEIRPTMLQEFAREHGAHKPEATAIDDGRFTLRSKVPLPAHIGDGCELTLTADEWRALMQSCGYEAVAKAAKKATSKAATVPLLNLPPECGPLIRKSMYGNKPESYEIVSITKADFQKMQKGWSDNTFVGVSVCGRFRFRIGVKPGTGGWNAPRVALFISDSKAHKLPDPEAVA